MKNLSRKIIILNLIIFLLWHFLSFQFMSHHFLVSTNNIFNGRYWTLITSVFSHYMFFHLFINMFILSNFGQFLETFIGRNRFLILYINSGLFGSILHCLSSSILIGDNDLNALGASGAISGLLIFYSLNFPKKLLYLFGIIPIPALFASALFVSLDLYGLFNQALGHGLPIGHGAHLGGAIFGGLYFGYLKLRN